MASKSRSNTYAAPCSIHADDNPENFDYIKYYHNLFVPVFFDDFVKWLQQQKKTQDVETTSISYATRCLKTLVLRAPLVAIGDQKAITSITVVSLCLY